MRCFLGSAGLAVLVLVGCGGGDQGPVAGDDLEKMRADNVLFDVEHFITSNGIRQAVLRSDTAYIYEDSALVELRQVRLTLYGSAGDEAAELTSDSGELNSRTDAMVARGNVVLITVDGGRRIETETLNYDPQRGRLWSDVATTLTEEGRIARGEGFTSDFSTDGRLQNTKVIRPSGTMDDAKIVF